MLKKVPDSISVSRVGRDGGRVLMYLSTSGNTANFIASAPNQLGWGMAATARLAVGVVIDGQGAVC